MTDTSTLKSPVLTPRQAAEYLRLSASTLARLRAQGTGPRYFKASPHASSHVRYRIQDLDDWLARQSQYISTANYPPPGMPAAGAKP